MSPLFFAWGAELMTKLLHAVVSTIKTGFIAIVAGTILAGCSSAAEPVKVDKRVAPDGSVLTVTALVDKVTIKSVKANRGNCADITANYVQHTRDFINFGENLVYVFSCNIIEAEITTDTDTYTFNWSD